jgi:hypothetical protein
VQVAGSLSGEAKVVKVLELEGLADHADVSDWFTGGGTAESLNKLISEAPEWSPLTPVDEAATAQPSPATPIEPPPIAHETGILELFKAEVRLRGLVGEERNAATLYLVLTSRLLERQVSAGVKGL